MLQFALLLIQLVQILFVFSGCIVCLCVIYLSFYPPILPLLQIAISNFPIFCLLFYFHFYSFRLALHTEHYNYGLNIITGRRPERNPMTHLLVLQETPVIQYNILWARLKQSIWCRPHIAGSHGSTRCSNWYLRRPNGGPFVVLSY